VLIRPRVAPGEGLESSSESVSADAWLLPALIRIETVFERFPGAKKIFRETPTLAMRPTVASLTEAETDTLPLRLIVISTVRPSLALYRDLEKAMIEGRGVERIACWAFIRP